MGHYHPARYAPHTLHYGYAPKVAARRYLAYTLWLAGWPAQALAQPFDQACAGAALVHQYRRAVEATAAYAERTLALAAEQGLAVWAAQEAIHHGWALAMEG